MRNFHQRNSLECRIRWSTVSCTCPQCNQVTAGIFLSAMRIEQVSLCSLLGCAASRVFACPVNDHRVNRCSVMCKTFRRPMFWQDAIAKTAVICVSVGIVRSSHASSPFDPITLKRLLLPGRRGFAWCRNGCANSIPRFHPCSLYSTSPNMQALAKPSFRK